MTTNNKKLWWIWLFGTIVLVGYFTNKLLTSDEDKKVFLPGNTTHGHYQIEMNCSACHSDSFSSDEEIQKSCMNCHAEELKIADDSHPKSKFTDPRNASRVAKLDARLCVTCHTEHKPEITGDMGLTVPVDVCVVCHADIEEDRPSHKGMGFETCASAGCHNFHDNTALYEDFLLKHANESNLLKTITTRKTDIHSRIKYARNYPVKKYPNQRLASSDKDSPSTVNVDPKIVEQWSITAHSFAGVNCTACHNVENAQGVVQWQDKPGFMSCSNCHDSEFKGFSEGKHGMRIAQNMTPMKPGLSRSEMKSTSHDKQLTCNSCHRSHNFDVVYAATESCLQCHNDKHSLAYKNSSHFKYWNKETIAGGESIKGVSCATCHMPKIEKKFIDGEKHFVVQHNQNDNLRPNEKMIRSVCMNCHGLEFSINALADQDLIDNNFQGQPKVHIKSIDMAVERVEKKSK